MGILSFLRSIFSRSTLPAKTEFLFVGLGNPGEKYFKTRHNVGFRVADALCETLGYSRIGEACDSSFCVSKNNDVVVAKPATYMNRSGDSVSALIGKLGLPVSSMVVLVDDFNIPLGRIRFRSGGSDGGHNGLKSISAHVGNDYPRLRVGIGPLPEGIDITSFVLGDFSNVEEERLKDVISRSVSALELYMKNGLNAVMNKYNS